MRVYIIIQLNDRTYRTICSEPKVTANKNIHTNKYIFLFIYIGFFLHFPAWDMKPRTQSK